MNREELVRKLELVGRALADNAMVPIFQCFVFDGESVYADNNNLTIIAPLTSDSTFAVHGATLLGLLRASHSDDVELKITGSDVLVKTGKSNFKLPYMPHEDALFKEPSKEWQVSVALDEKLLLGIENCLTTSSKDEATQPALVGVSLQREHLLYSCDGDALTRDQFQAFGDYNQNSYMMPNAFCETILKVIYAHKMDDDYSLGTLSFNGEWVTAQIGVYTVYSRLIIKEAPLDHEDLIKKTMKAEPTYVMVPKGLKDALLRARVVADPEGKPTQLTVSGGKLELVTNSPLGTVRDVLPFKHPDVVALVSPALLQRSIGLCDEMSILENCCVFKKGDELFQLLSNFG